MEEELQSAASLYQENITTLRESLASDPENDELLQLLKELEEALDSTLQALQQLRSTAAGDIAAASAAQPATAATTAVETLPGIGPQPQLPAAAPMAAVAAAAATAGLQQGGGQGPLGRQAAAGAAGAVGPQMHPRNKYATELPDFAALAEQYPALQPYLQRRGGPASRPSIDFTSPEACRQLTQVLLKHDYGIDWWVPLGQLVPPVTNRANYIHWLEDLLALSSPPDMDGVVGLDVGCGANLIYPLLGAAIAGWRFVGVDVTEVALEWAEANKRSNPHLAPLLEVRRAAMQPEQHSMHSAHSAAAAAAAAGAGEGENDGRPRKRAKRKQQAGEQAQHGQQQQGQQQGQQGQQQGEQGQREGEGVRVDEGQQEAGEQQQLQSQEEKDLGQAPSSGGGVAASAEAATEDTGPVPSSEQPHPHSPGPESPQAAPEQHVSIDKPTSSQAAREHLPQATISSSPRAGSGILSGAVRPGERFSFCMCNPPFFGSMGEAGRNPGTAFAGTAEEMVYPGGELAFVEAMVEDSRQLQGQIHWYTTMVGKKGTLKAVRALLYRLGVRVLRTTEFVQGKTSRWALAWSFTADPSVNQKPLPRPPPLAHPGV